MNQLELFDKQEKIDEFKFEHKSRGWIKNEEIWNELDIHSKINLRINYGCDADTTPNFMMLNHAFECGMDLTPFVDELGKQHNDFFLGSTIRKIKPR